MAIVSSGEAIMQAIMDTLNAPTDKPLPTVRNRPRPIAVEYADGTSGIDAFLLYAVKEMSERKSTNLVLRQRTIRIEIPVAGPPPLDQAADPLYLFIVNTLFNSPAVMSLCNWLEERGLVWETESSYEDASVCLLELEFAYITTTDPTRRSPQ
jgi:hypothetical protein